MASEVFAIEVENGKATKTGVEIAAAHKVNSYRSPLANKVDGDRVSFVCTGDLIKTTNEVVRDGKKHTQIALFAKGEGAFRLKLEEGFDANKYLAGKEYNCVVVTREIDGVNRSWLALAD